MSNKCIVQVPQQCPSVYLASGTLVEKPCHDDSSPQVPTTVQTESTVGKGMYLTISDHSQTIHRCLHRRVIWQVTDKLAVNAT